MRLAVWRGLQLLVTKVLPTNVQAGPLMTFLTEGKTVPAELVVVPATICFCKVVSESVLAALLEGGAEATAKAKIPAATRYLVGRRTARNMPETITSISGSTMSRAGKTVQMIVQERESPKSAIFQTSAIGSVALAVTCCGVVL